MSTSPDLILNVDDTDAARYAKTRILTRAGFNVVEASNGSDAITAAVAQMPALILLDVKLPDINGFEVCRRLKQDSATKNIMVLQTSASYIASADKIRALEGGADNYLFEPIEPEELVANVKALLRLSRVERDLREADRRKDEFLAVLAHELRNPLAPIRNSAELLKHLAPKNDEKLEKVYGTIIRQTEHMVRLIDDLLDVSRISKGKIALRMEFVDLLAAVKEGIESASPIIRRHGHVLCVNMEPMDRHVLGDRIRIAQVVCNLLNNAAKFTPSGGSIGLHLYREGDNAVIRVEDSGIGISAINLPSLFQLFSQADHLPDRTPEGLGIGLALVKALVEMHGGSVIARSEGSGKGSVFEVRLPTREASPHVTVDNPVAPDRGSFRILVVDDNLDSADSVASLLEARGHSTRTANDGSNALAIAEQFLPQVIILDIGLPVMSGYEVARRLRGTAGCKESAIIALSGYGQEIDKYKAHDAGFDAYLIKPAAPDNLYAEIAALMRRSN
ncbi:MAG TPA: response regulator [Noviherbaspirillum sp.]|nr:response regulator [Noviherbaspirillum sp.]